MTRFPAGPLTAPSGATKNLSIFENGGATLPRSEEDLAAATVGAVGVLLDQEATMAIVTQPTTPTPQGDRPPRRRGLLLAVLSSLLVAAVIVAAIVVLQGDDAADTVVTDGTSSATVAPQTDEQKIVAVYKGFIQAENAALAAADPGLPLLGVYATGAQLKASSDAAAKLRSDGMVAVAPPNSVADVRVTVTSVQGDRARIQVCLLDDGYLVNAKTGVPLAPSRVITESRAGEMLFEGGVWKLSSSNRTEKWDGVAGCWVGR